MTLVRRAFLPPLERAVAEALDEVLHREHGIVSSHPGQDLFLEQVRERGYHVTPAAEAVDVAGKVAVVRISRQPEPDLLEPLGKTLRDAGATSVLVFGGEQPDLSTLDEDEMRRAGWVRATEPV